MLYTLSGTSVMSAVRKGLIYMMPLFVVGACTSFLLNLPLPIYQNFMNTSFGGHWQAFLSIVYQGTFQIVSFGALLSVTYFLVKGKNEKRSEEVNFVPVLLVAICCFFIMQHVENDTIGFALFGQTNLLLSIIIGVLSVNLFFFFYDHKLFKVKLFTADSDILFTQTIYILEPALLTIVSFSIIRVVLHFFNITDLNAFIYESVRSFIPQKANIGAALFYIFLLHFFWYLGVHGSAATIQILLALWLPPMRENTAALGSGEIPSNILSLVFFDNFVTLGGSGAVLCLILALLIRAKKTNTHKLARFSLPLVLFNINESVIYGLPIVLNPVYIVPFLFVPIVLTLISYAAMTLHLVPVAAVRVPWTTPIIISGFQTTGSISGSILQIFNLVVGTCLYLPFVHIAEKIKEKAHLKVFDSLNDCVIKMEIQPSHYLLNRQDDIGYLARTLAYDLRENLEHASDDLFMVYQPQIDDKKNLYGCEALLRWRHEKFGLIPPPTVIAIAEEAGLHNKLNEWIFTTVLEAQVKLQSSGHDQFVMSINISPLQLHNANIVEILRTSVKKNHLNPNLIEVEVTENVALNDSRETRTALKAFKDIGVRLAIDDFGMGHTSIQYIRSFQFNTVKLDGSLVSDILSNESSKDIVRALVSLAANQDMHVIAEYVESEEQKELLKELGCQIYQGYLYSQPLLTDTLEQFIVEQKDGVHSL
ncbi:MAG: EAL domain-containing protein [Spirochaetaceae bacterium]|nr:EAL domain-containing protein [Spirochaetaceae bacterium]